MAHRADRYGTSIQQGGVASRAGNTYDALISRHMNREVRGGGSRHSHSYSHLDVFICCKSIFLLFLLLLFLFDALRTGRCLRPCAGVGAGAGEECLKNTFSGGSTYYSISKRFLNTSLLLTLLHVLLHPIFTWPVTHTRACALYMHIMCKVYNVGFANNGVMELSVGALLGDITEAAAIVIDCLPNMNTEQVTNRTAPLVQYLRANG